MTLVFATLWRSMRRVHGEMTSLQHIPAFLVAVHVERVEVGPHCASKQCHILRDDRLQIHVRTLSMSDLGEPTIFPRRSSRPMVLMSICE